MPCGRRTGYGSAAGDQEVVSRANGHARMIAIAAWRGGTWKMGVKADGFGPWGGQIGSTREVRASGCRNLIHETCIEQPSSWDFTTSCCNGIRCQGSCRYDVSWIHPRRWFWLLPWPANFDWVNARLLAGRVPSGGSVCGGALVLLAGGVRVVWLPARGAMQVTEPQRTQIQGSTKPLHVRLAAHGRPG